MPKTHAPYVNLKPQDPFLSSPLGRVLSWATGVGRYLVIFTEFVVVSVIFAKFTLDKQLTDLNATITQKSNIIASYEDTEAQVREVQRKLDYLSKENTQLTVLNGLDIVAKNLPPETKIENVKVAGGQVSFNGSALNSRALSILITNFRKDPRVRQITVSNIKQSENEDDPGFIFSMILDTQKSAAMPPTPLVPPGSSSTPPSPSPSPTPSTKK